MHIICNGETVRVSSVFVDIRNSSGLYVQGEAVSRTCKKERVACNSVVGIEADSDVTRVGDLLMDAGESTMGKFTKKILWKL